MSQVKKRSPLWYELPLLFAIVGGVIAYFKIKKDDPKKARNCIYLGIIFSVGFGFMIGLPLIFGTDNPFFVVSSGSMVPVLQVFDVMIVNANEPFEDVQIGDIIVFKRPTGQDRIIVARVDAIIDEEPLTLRTKGDANPASIPGTDFPITEEEYIGTLTYVIPQFGYFTRIIAPPIGYIITAIILGIPVVRHIQYRKEKHDLNE